jgi:hypothetical protein
MQILFIIAGTIIFLLIVALFTKKDYSVKREIIVNKPTTEVFNYIKYLKNHDNFKNYTMKDPDMKRVFKGTDGTAGFVYLWEGNRKVGKGEKEIMRVVEGLTMESQIRFEKPFEAIANNTLVTETFDENKTKVTWTMNSKLKYPMNIMLLFMNIEKMLGRDMDTSLATLKNILEK